MSIDFHRLVRPIDINRLILIDCFPMIGYYRLGTLGFNQSRCSSNFSLSGLKPLKVKSTSVYNFVSRVEVIEVVH